jgi:bacteriochlorophyll 4-vinyl reductase
MREGGVGRVLVASLHQGVSDVLPARMAFYEHWLHVEGLSEGTIGLAAVQAVLSFLRQEGGATYDAVMARAGSCASDWTVDSMTPLKQRALRALPEFLRRRMLLSAAGRLVRETASQTRAAWRVRHGVILIELHGSIFCGVRQPAPHPLCGFYAVAYTKLLSRFGIDMPVVMAGCRGAGASTCTLEIGPLRPQAADTGEVAA